MSRRTTLSLKEKIKLLNDIEKEANKSHRSLSKTFGLSKSYIGKILAAKDTLKSDWAQCTENGDGSKNRKRFREGKDNEVDEALKLWFTDARNRGLPCSGPLLRAKAEDLAKNLGKTDFVASDGWLSRWKARHGILYKKMHGEKQDADTEAAEDWRSCVLPELLLTYGPDDIYNADETGLYYRATPDGTLAFKNLFLDLKKPWIELQHWYAAICREQTKRNCFSLGKVLTPAVSRALKSRVFLWTIETIKTLG